LGGKTQKRENPGESKELSKKNLVKKLPIFSILSCFSTLNLILKNAIVERKLIQR
jgi:hypothetical protein